MPKQPKCSTCNGTGKRGKAKLYNSDGTVRRVYALACTTCNGTGRQV